jgi:hypothetical protein
MSISPETLAPLPSGCERREQGVALWYGEGSAARPSCRAKNRVEYVKDWEERMKIHLVEVEITLLSLRKVGEGGEGTFK